MATRKDTESNLVPERLGRRKFLNAAAITGLAGAGLSLGVAGCSKDDATPDAASATGTGAAGEIDFAKYAVHPGQLDEYYAFSSGGHSGEVRIYALPSGRMLKRIPVFNIDCMVGWGITNERSEEHTSELQSLMRISYAVFCLKKKHTRKPYS